MKTETKIEATPGPWLIDCTDEAINTYKNGMVIRTADPKNIIAVVTHELENWKEQEKNVLLIAAAPDMLEALEEAFAQSLPGENPDLYAKMRLAISKARGL